MKVVKLEGEEELIIIMEILKKDYMAIPCLQRKGIVVGVVSICTKRQGVWDPKGKRSHDEETEDLTFCGAYMRKTMGYTVAAWVIIETTGNTDV